MASKTRGSAGSGSRVLTMIWFMVSAAAAYPAYSMLSSWGLNQALTITFIFIGICLFYDIPYRARVKEEYEENMRRADQHRSRIS